MESLDRESELSADQLESLRPFIQAMAKALLKDLERED
jgi:hypothetical protein